MDIVLRCTSASVNEYSLCVQAQSGTLIIQSYVVSCIQQVDMSSFDNLLSFAEYGITFLSLRILVHSVSAMVNQIASQVILRMLGQHEVYTTQVYETSRRRIDQGTGKFSYFFYSISILNFVVLLFSCMFSFRSPFSIES